MAQFPLPLPAQPDYSLAQFIPSPCNEEALGWISRWPDWPGGSLLLSGAEGAGKTHLGMGWAARAGAQLNPPDAAALASHALIDPLESWPDEALLHLLNVARERSFSLLLLARAPAAQLAFTLPDLTSRLRALPHVAIGAPDDALLAAVLRKQFSDRQLPVDEELIAYLAPRIERSFASARAVVAKLDSASLAQQRPITIPLTRQVLGDS
jgi:chromosomal replication initiation ATPase DnaA